MSGEKQIMFSSEYLCNGLGIAECLCGGDFCICSNYGEIECGGCDACDPDLELEQ